MGEIWSIRGVPPEFQRACISAAKGEGKNLAKWLIEKIKDGLNHNAPPPNLGMSDPMILQSIQDRLDGLETVVADLANPSPPAAASSPPATPSPPAPPSSVRDQVDQMLSQGLKSREIIEALNTAGVRTSSGKPWTVDGLNSWLRRNRVAK